MNHQTDAVFPVSAPVLTKPKQRILEYGFLTLCGAVMVSWLLWLAYVFTSAMQWLFS